MGEKSEIIPPLHATSLTYSSFILIHRINGLYDLTPLKVYVHDGRFGVAL